MFHLPKKTLMIAATGSLVVLSFYNQVHAAIPPDTSRAEKLLNVPGRLQYEQFRKLGAQSYWDLKTIAFNEQKHMKLRWKALMAMGRLGEKHSIPEMKQALKAKDWFMRDASLKVLPMLDAAEAYSAAIKACDDSALVVRTTAVDTIKKLKRADASKKLWSMLYDKNNYMKKQSLWIRRHIVEALSEIAPKGSEGAFVKVFDDADSTLYEPAIKGLERLTGKKLGDAREAANYRRYQWVQWWKAQPRG